MKTYIVTEEDLSTLIKNNFKEGKLTSVLRDWLKTMEELPISEKQTSEDDTSDVFYRYSLKYFTHLGLNQK